METNNHGTAKPFAEAHGSAELGALLEDYRRERRQYESCSGTDVFAKKYGHRNGMKTIAMKIAEMLTAPPNVEVSQSETKPTANKDQ